jgi:ABC-2 type transport system permease protein
MQSVLGIINKDIIQWTRRPLYFIASVLLAILIIGVVGNTLSGPVNMPFGLCDSANLSKLAVLFGKSGRFRVVRYRSLETAKQDLFNGKIVALADVSQDPLEDSVLIMTEGHNPFIDYQTSQALLSALTDKSNNLELPLHTAALFPIKLSLRDYITPGLAAYLCYVLASMNLGFSWIYEWMERTYRQIILAPNGLRAAIIAKTLTVTLEASLVLWLALCITAPLFGFTLGNNFSGLIVCTLASMFAFTCMGLGVACLLKTIRVYTMTVSIFGVALMFVSGIIIPVEAMPTWEQVGAKIFPMYYSADAFKGVMLGTPAHYSLDAVVLTVWACLGLGFAILLLNRRQAAL